VVKNIFHIEKRAEEMALQKEGCYKTSRYASKSRTNNTKTDKAKENGNAL